MKLDKETKRRLVFCIIPITIAICAGMFSRSSYVIISDEFDTKPQKKVLDFRFSFMQFDVINNYMLFWSLFAVISFWLFFLKSEENDYYLKDVFSRWLLSFLCFVIFFLWYKVSDPDNYQLFNPSGHVMSGLISMANYMSCYNFVKRKPVDKHLFYGESRVLRRITFSVYIAFLVHTCYSLYFTAFIFHSMLETILGWAFGLITIILTYETDYFVTFIFLPLRFIG